MEPRTEPHRTVVGAHLAPARRFAAKAYDARARLFSGYAGRCGSCRVQAPPRAGRVNPSAYLSNR